MASKNKSDYAYTPDDIPSHWKLDISDKQHTALAKAALGKGYRGQKVIIPAKYRAAVIRKLNKACEKFGLEPFKDSSMSHSDMYLMHFGVKGMKWGVRKKNPNYNSTQRKNDRAIYGRGAEKRINTRMNQGMGISGARAMEKQTQKQRAVKRQRRVRNAKAIVSTAATLAAYDMVYNNGRKTRAVVNGAKYASAVAAGVTVREATKMAAKIYNATSPLRNR